MYNRNTDLTKAVHVSFFTLPFSHTGDWAPCLQSSSSLKVANYNTLIEPLITPVVSSGCKSSYTEEIRWPGAPGIGWVGIIKEVVEELSHYIPFYLEAQLSEPSSLGTIIAQDVQWCLNFSWQKSLKGIAKLQSFRKSKILLLRTAERVQKSLKNSV